MSMHSAIAQEIKVLQSKFPDKEELTLDEYADYMNIGRREASRHFARRNIPHKRIGKSIRINTIDFALFLAQQKIVNGRPLKLTSEDLKRKRGFTYEHL